MDGRVCVKVVDSCLSVDEATRFVNDESCGAVSVFIGVTRKDNVDNGIVTGLEFEAHIPLAIAIMNEIAREYMDKEPQVRRVFISHRLGFVRVGETNVILAVSSGHRDVSMRATQELMDTLKAKVPVWKKEVLDNGKYVWKANKEWILASN